MAFAAAQMTGLGLPCEARSEDNRKPSLIDWQAYKLGPKSDLSVLWAGHSLMEQKAESSWGSVDLMSIVGRFAESRKLSYVMTDHTLFGSPLSALWRGSPHSFYRNASEMVEKRELFERETDRYDTLVLTDVIPLGGTLEYEFSSYYVRRFACALWQANPQARVYLYQTWIHFQGSHRGDGEGFDWRAEMLDERAHWEELGNAAGKAPVEAPHWLSRFGWRAQSDGGCTIEAPIFMVPVGNALLALDARLSAPRLDDHFSWPDQTAFKLIDMVSNPILTTHDTAEKRPNGPARDPSRAADDIHFSLSGIYFSALVHFATLYRQTPVGLPYPTEVGEPLARTFQCIAWETVLGDERAGVLGDPSC